MAIDVKLEFCFFVDEGSESGTAAERQLLAAELIRYVREEFFGGNEDAHSKFLEEFTLDRAAPELEEVEELIRERLREPPQPETASASFSFDRTLEIDAPIPTDSGEDGPYTPQLQPPYIYNGQGECIHPYKLLNGGPELDEAIADEDHEAIKRRRPRLSVSGVGVQGHLGIVLTFTVTGS